MSHARDFGSESGNTLAAEALIWDYRQADLDARTMILCDFAVKLTGHPAATDANDIVGLHAAAWNDDQIHVATQVIAYFNFINRVAEALGVEPEPWMTLDPKTWRNSKFRPTVNRGQN